MKVLGNKIIKMTLPEKGYSAFKELMNKMKFSNEDLFLRYCVLTVGKNKMNIIQRKLADSEIKRIKSAEKELQENKK